MYSSKESFDLTSENTYRINNGHHRSKGCRLSLTAGFILTFLAVAVAVGVGLIVHFAGTNKDVTCQCHCGSATTPASSGDNSLPQVCTILASAAYQPLCNLCSKSTTSKSLDTTTTTAKPTPTTPAPIRDTRLPTSLKPVHYDLRLRPDIYGTNPTFIFTGDIEMIIECVSETSNITVHMKELQLTANPVFTSSTGSPTYKDHSLDVARQFLIVNLSGGLTAGQTYTLRLQFQGKLADNLLGFYKSYYSDGTKLVHLAFATFQPTEARKAYPCFDEPGMKATYNVSLDRKTDSDIFTLTNMPKTGSVQLNDGFTRDKFKKSVPMSSYLVAFAFTNFPEKTNYSSGGTKMRVFAEPSQINNTDLALQLNGELLDAFESYFGIKFSLPKLDSMAAPQFYAGALEQWGLVTYEANVLYYTPGITATRIYDNSHVTVAHELAHQWCGNLVSPMFWDDLWMNEGYATFMSYLGLDMIRPSWKTVELKVVQSFQHAMEKDGYESSHPMYMDVRLPSEIFAIFDPISYDKAGAIVRMMRFILGDDTFRFGMQDFLNSNAYKGVTHHDLFASLESRARSDGQNIKFETIMDTWIEQMNHPVVKVTFDSNAGEVTLNQQRFLFDCVHDRTKCEQSSYMWEIPITYATSNSPDFQQTYRNITWMSKTERTKKITDTNLPSPTGGWILANIQQYGFYRVTYSQDNWNALQNQLMKDHTVIHPLNRAQLIDDSWALSKAGMLDVSIALKMMNYLKKETEYTPWLAAKADLQLLASILEPTKTYGKLEAYIVGLIKDHFEGIDILNLEKKSVQVRFFSGLMFDLACKYYIQRCEDQALQMFTNYRTKGKLIPPDVTITVLCTAVREGGETEWNHLYNLYKTAPGFAGTVISALGCTRRHWLQRRLLDYSIMKDKIDNAHMVSAIEAVATNPDGFHQALNFLMTNWKFLVTEYSDPKILNSLITHITRTMYTDNAIKEVTFWRDEIHPAGAVKLDAFDTAIATIKVNKEWFNKNLQKIDDWLA